MRKIVINGYENAKRIHLIGIGGISMSAIAQMLVVNGFEVTGSDTQEGEQIEVLRKVGIPVTIGHNPEIAKKADLIIYTAAIKETDVEYVAGKEAGIPLIERAIFIGILTKQYENSIAISGTHGKTTTTSFITNIFLEANLDPTVQVGAYLRDINGNYQIGNSSYFIFESCEYKDSFLHFYPKTAVILNVDADHLDYFKDIEAIVNSFEKFTDNVTENGIVILNEEDAHKEEIVEYINKKNKEENRNTKVTTFGLNSGDYVAEDIVFENGKTKFIVLEKLTGIRQEVNLQVMGTYNVLNALAAYATGRMYEIDSKIVANGLHRFAGVHRRFEFRGTVNEANVYDDYAHHPTEIMALATSVNKMNYDNVYAIFQPHTYSRTKALKNEFVNALSKFDNVILTKIYAAREMLDPEIKEEEIVGKLKEKGTNAVYIEKFEDISKYIKEKAKKGDLVLTIGAGTVTNIGELLTK